MPDNRKTILYIATSLDGYIAKPNDDLSFLTIVQKEGEDYGYNNFIKNIDTVIVGRKTYDWVMKQVIEFPHKNKNTFVITRTARPTIGNIQFYTGNIKKLITQLKSEKGKNIFIDGGAEIVNLLLNEDLIDEIVISIVPIIIGSGIKLFNDGCPEKKLNLLSSQQYKTGLVQLHYLK